MEVPNDSPLRSHTGSLFVTRTGVAWVILGYHGKLQGSWCKTIDSNGTVRLGEVGVMRLILTDLKWKPR